MNAIPASGPTHRPWAPPPWGNSSGMLTLINFFGGGAALWIGAAASLAALWTEYDGITTIIGMVVAPFLIAIPSAIVAMLVGLPVRLIPPIRRWWLRHGGYTIIGAAGGFVLLCVGVVLLRVSSEASPPTADGWQIALAGWTLFSLFTMHIVWPQRWSGLSNGPIPLR